MICFIHRIDGAGQGQGWSPTIWMNTHDITLTALNKYPGMLIQNPEKTIQSHRQCDVLMDDTSLGTSEVNVWTKRKKNETIEKLGLPQSEAHSVTKQLQILGQKYERFHSITGGRDNLHKSFFYFNKPMRNKLKYEYAKISKTKKEKIWQNECFTTKTHETKRIESNTYHRTCGFWISPSGGNKGAVIALEDKVSKWTANIIQATLYRDAIIRATTTVLIPRIYYMLPIANITEKDGMNIIQPAMRIISNALKLPVTTNRRLLLAPKKYGGIGLEKLNIY